MKKKEIIKDVSEYFATVLTNKNEYLTQIWEKDWHRRCIREAYEWGTKH